MLETPKVTVITITYNLINAGREKYFRQCVESVHSQSYKNIEHIIIDGASTDGTLDLIKEYAEKGWLSYCSEKDQGVYYAMNKGIDKANGNYINFLNSDDYFNHPDGIKLSVKSLLATNSDYSFAESVIVNREDEYLGTLKPMIESFLFRTPFCHQTMLIKKEVLLKLNKFDENFISAADFDLVLRLCLSGAKYVQVPLKFVSYRLGGLSDLNQDQSINEYARSCIKNLNSLVGHQIETYNNMYANLLMPKNLYDALINVLHPRYKIKMIRLIKYHSTNQGPFYKIEKYPQIKQPTYLRRKLIKLMALMKDKISTL